MQVTVSLADARNLYGAESRTRTDDLLITNQRTYQQGENSVQTIALEEDLFRPHLSKDYKQVI
jgi:hypothetical protein